ncbi:MAG: DNA cytosine methyltransferase [Rhodobacteraceae bacterium]|nr:DNA cytosine methyltransferase [Paracoccaceae bacterium]
MRQLTSIEFCAGAGGQALGLETAGFRHDLLLDNDEHCCATLRLNRPDWNVVCADMQTATAHEYAGIDLFAGGLPCPPFSVAGKQLGEKDERNLFDDALRLIAEAKPKFVLIENVRGFLAPTFDGFRKKLRRKFRALGYEIEWRLFNASDFGVPQLRPRVAIVAAQKAYWSNFSFPEGDATPQTVGETLVDLMAQDGWKGARAWAAQANTIAPTIVGGSKKHGGPDLGPTRARNAWLKLGVNGKSLANEPPQKGATEIPRLTARMVARLQGFPDAWAFSGRKTNAYRQIGNAFPPPVAAALGLQIAKAIYATEATQEDRSKMAAE